KSLNTALYKAVLIMFENLLFSAGFYKSFGFGHVLLVHIVKDLTDTHFTQLAAMNMATGVETFTTRFCKGDEHEPHYNASACLNLRFPPGTGIILCIHEMTRRELRNVVFYGTFLYCVLIEEKFPDIRGESVCKNLNNNAQISV